MLTHHHSAVIRPVLQDFFAAAAHWVSKDVKALASVGVMKKDEG
jgi:hypothetical protein